MYIHEIKNKVLPSYVNSLTTKWHITGNPTASYSMKPYGTNFEKRMLTVRLCSPEQQFQLSSANNAQAIWKLFAWYWRELKPNLSARLYISQCLMHID